MRILDRYIGTAVVGGTLIVMCVLLALFTFVELVGEIEHIGRGSYGVPQALQYLLLTLPRHAYQLLPVAALLGSLIGLGVLAGSNELLVMRATGMSLQRIVRATLQAALLLIVAGVALGEFVVPHTEQYGQELRVRALEAPGALQTAEGFWTRDGSNYINVRAVLPGGRLAGVYIYEFDEQQGLRMFASARSATYQGGTWTLERVARSRIDAGRVTTENLARLDWQSQLRPELLDTIAVKPYSLSASGLYRYARYLRENGLSALRYELELWRKAVLPFATAVMVMLAVPFVFGPLRSVGVGQRVLVGTLAGVGFQLFDQIFGYVCQVYEVSPFASAVLPTALFFAVALYLMRKVF